jgi:hypothetical protein
MNTIRGLNSGLAIALLVAAIAAIWGGVVAPVLARLDLDRTTIAQDRRLSARYEQLGAELPRLEQQIKKLQSPGGEPTGFLEGGSPAMLAAKLQSNIQKIVADAGLSLRNSRTLPLAKEQDFNRVALQIELEISATGLQKLLHGIEASKPALFIQKLTVRAPENGAATFGSDGQPTQTVTLEIAGYTMMSPQ